MAQLGHTPQSSEASGGRQEVLCPWDSQGGGTITAKPVAADQPSTASAGSVWGHGGEEREEVGDVLGSLPAGGEGGGAGHQRVGRPTSRP